MVTIKAIGVAGSLGILALASPAFAQDAAETAVILSGTSGQGQAANSLGNAVRGSMDSAANTIRSAPRQGNRAATRRSNRRGPVQIQTIPSNDPLEGTDATRFQTRSGATISVSGRMQPSASARCVENCNAPPAQDEEPTAEESNSSPE